VSISPPDPSVAEWPVIGESVHEIWTEAATNLETLVNRFEDQLKQFGTGAIKFAGGILFTILLFVFSILIAGGLMGSGESGYRAARNIAGSLMGDETGDRMTDMSIVTIRSVVKGVLGVAIIQALLAAVGLLLMDVPAAGLWAGAVLVVAIIQLPPLLVLGPIAFWVFSVADPVPATIFLVYSMLVSFCDAVLKPMLLGRGVETPMLVILIGAIGGAISNGVIGLFVGSVILSIGYNLMAAWMAPDDEAAAEAEA
jgi:predicted PurR-regulated permease PerM